MPEESKTLIFVTHGPDERQRCATPFYMATMAAAMDSEARIVFQIDGVLLMKKGVPENLEALEGGGNPSLTSSGKPRRRAWNFTPVPLPSTFMA